MQNPGLLIEVWTLQSGPDLGTNTDMMSSFSCFSFMQILFSAPLLVWTWLGNSDIWITDSGPGQEVTWMALGGCHTNSLWDLRRRFSSFWAPVATSLLWERLDQGLWLPTGSWVFTSPLSQGGWTRLAEKIYCGSDREFKQTTKLDLQYDHIICLA